jgi:hypothetical protein
MTPECAPLLRPPLSWDHYFIFLAIPMVIVVDHLLASKRKGYYERNNPLIPSGFSAILPE